MIEPSNAAFPSNIVLALHAYFSRMNNGVTVLKRPIREGDPIQAIGITAGMWIPDEESYEFQGMGGMTGPTISQYLIGVQTFVQDMDSERGLQTSATLAGMVRSRLSRDADLRVALGALQSSEFGYTERFKRSRIQSQQFVSNEIEGQFLFLANLEFLVETETMS